MSKHFKVGDKVQRNRKVYGKIMRGVIVAKNSSDSIDIKLTEGAGSYAAGDIYAGSIYFWEVIEEADELPPAPKSVRYHHEHGRGLTSDSYLDVYSGSFASGPRIRLRNKDNIGITIDADTALQLAHDLRRMAMDIKRKEKADVL